MRAFVSYSLHSSEKYILSLLSIKLAEKNVAVISRYNSSFYNEASNMNHLTSANLFIGIISASGAINAKGKVLKEWNLAIKTKIPNILLVENLVVLPKEIIGSRSTIIRFNRQNIEAALNYVNENLVKTSKIIRNRKVHGIGTTKNIGSNKKEGDTTLSWILGGAAALLLLDLFSSKDEN